MAATESTSFEHKLHTAICLLSLITERPPDLFELLEQNNVPANDDVDDADVDLEDVEEDSEITGAEEEAKSQAHLAVLRNKVLDRLAETLARFKSDPSGNSRSRIDSKHVSSTIMYYNSMRVKFLCAKNEGLDQENSTDDTEFLDSWSRQMEQISRKGTALTHKLPA